MPSKLDQLRAMTVVVGDTGDIDAVRRLKPQDCTTNPTLLLKAVARRRPDRIAQAFGAVARHLEGARSGLWIERMDAGGREIVQAAPATSLYHLTAAFTDDAVLGLVV